MSVRLFLAAILLGIHFDSWFVFIAGFLTAWTVGILRNEIRARLIAAEDRIKRAIRGIR